MEFKLYCSRHLDVELEVKHIGTNQYDVKPCHKCLIDEHDRSYNEGYDDCSSDNYENI